MTDRILKAVQIAIEAGILICLIPIMKTSLAVGRLAEEKPDWIAKTQGIAVRVVNDDDSAMPVKIKTGLVHEDGQYKYQYDIPLPVRAK